MMSTSEQQPALPDDLETSQSKLVYPSILTMVEETVSDLQRSFGLSKLTLLLVLTSPASNDLVPRTEDGYASR